MTHSHTHISIIVCAAALPALFACSSPVDVGREDEDTFTAGGSADLDSGPLDSDPVGCGELDGAQRALEQLRLDYRSQDWDSLKGTSWSGQIDFGPTLRLQIDAEGKGEITFGEGTLPPQPDDPGIGYICEFNDFECGKTPQEGFPYRTVKATLEDARVSFSVVTAEPWDAVCALQPPMEEEESACSFGIYDDTKYIATETPDGCLLSDDAGDTMLVNCDWTALELVCACSGERCFARPGYTAGFELTLSSDSSEMTGSYASSPDTTSHVELRRD
jgi:hypothetical protein